LPIADITAKGGLKKVLAMPVNHPTRMKGYKKMRMNCFKKFFSMSEELAKVKEEYSRFSSCSE